MNSPEQTRAFGYVYGAAHLGKSLTWYFSELLFAYFLTEFCGLKALTMGKVLAASFIFSAVVDPFVGKSLGRLAQSVGRASRLQAMGAIISGASLVIFSATGIVPGPWRLVYALSASCAFRLAYAFYDVPQNAILSLASATPEIRMGLAAIRIAGSGVATLVVALTAATLISSAPGLGAGRFLWVSLVFAVLGGVSAVALGAQTPDASAPAPARSTPATPTTVEADPTIASGALWRFIAILGVTAVVAGALSVFSRLEPYFTRAVVADRSTRMVILALMALGGATSQPLWTGLARRSAFGASFAASALTVVIGTGVFVFAVGRNTAALAFGGFLFGAGNSGLSMLLWSVFADIVANERRSRYVPGPSLAFAILTSAIKLAAAASILVVSHVLAGIDYHSAKVAASWSLVAPMAAGPLIGAAVCLVVGPFLWAPDDQPRRRNWPSQLWLRRRSVQTERTT